MITALLLCGPAWAGCGINESADLDSGDPFTVHVCAAVTEACDPASTAPSMIDNCRDLRLAAAPECFLYQDGLFIAIPCEQDEF